MANNEIIKVVDVGNRSDIIRTSDLLPSYLRTDKNVKFLSSTLDQFVQRPLVERISGYIGSKTSPNYNPLTDNYIPAANDLSADYQLEPALIVRDDKQTVQKTLGYDDLINQIAFENGLVNNHNRLYKSEVYSYNPHIDWDKFVNFNQYYWLPTGPDSIEITGPTEATVSTYTVTDDPTKQILIFSPDGVTPDPLVRLYRGMTYVFNIDSKHTVWIKQAVSEGAQDAYENAVNNGVKQGQIILTVDSTTPATLFYVAGDDATIAGRFTIENLTSNSKIDIENEILGKVSYTSGNGIKFTNGMRIRFNGHITPESYNNKDWLVEGVGSSITLTDWQSLANAGLTLTNLDVNFDANPFDEYPFDDFSNTPLTPEYITINKSSRDGNAWSRYNRWFHADVITAAAKANNTEALFPQSQRASRPIIEFKPNLQLFRYGSSIVAPIDCIDNVTKKVFQIVEGSAGFYIDGTLLDEGYRVVFNADPDPLVNGRIFQVKFVTINGAKVVSLQPTEDSIPVVGAGAAVLRGDNTAGTNWYYDGVSWQKAQQKTAINQFPLFDVFDANGISYGDTSVYKSTFVGTAIFGYTPGTIPDAVLGLNLKYLNVANIGDYLFTNYFDTDSFALTMGSTIETTPVNAGYLKINTPTSFTYETVWSLTSVVDIPIIQFEVVTQSINLVEITSVESPGYATDIRITVFVNEVKKTFGTDYRFVAQGQQYFVYFPVALNDNDKLLFKIYTTNSPSDTGYYDLALSGTNNPLNGVISQFTLAEVTDHVKTITENCPSFAGNFPGDSNLRDIGKLSNWGTRLISHANPLSFAGLFIGLKENNLIDAVRRVGTQYNSFKIAFLTAISKIKGNYTPTDALDIAMQQLTNGKNSTFPYAYSDMLGVGSDYSLRTYTVTDTRIVNYSMNSEFDITVLGERAVYIYVNDVIQVYGLDYVFSTMNAVVEFQRSLNVGDVIKIKDYTSTVGSYVPPTPTKLGLYPKFVPSIYIDDTYITPTKVIQGHDGSITVAFGDYRDAIILEYETRIYNNLKINYNADLINIDDVLPGAFRSSDYGLGEVNSILVAEFLHWAGFFGIDYITHSTYDYNNQFTYNFRPGTVDAILNLPVPGNWRGIYKWFYDTDRPHTCPWEMLGFKVQPDWWTSVYGPAPYTSGNLLLWTDLETGTIQQGPRAGIDIRYARPNLLNFLPVDDGGNLLSPAVIGLIAPSSINDALVSENWIFGDHGPAENAWRRSSLWPFAVQVLLALTQPAKYASVMWDPSRLLENLSGQYRYGSNDAFLSPKNLMIPHDTDSMGNRILASGYSVMLIDANTQGNYNYTAQLKTTLANVNYNLMAKMGGYVSKEKLQVVIDAVDPTSTNPGVLLPLEDYEIYANKSNPVENYSISGVIVQKTVDGWTVRGYDRSRPYFPIYKVIPTSADITINTGGRSESFLIWTTGSFYASGSIAQYNNGYYRCVLAHTAGTSFAVANWNKLSSLPVIGGVTVTVARQFEDNLTYINYGTVFGTVQEVFDLFMGYQKYLTSIGFIFDEKQSDLGEVLDWTFSGKEFLYWTTQNWSPDSIITVSPFADKLKFQMTNAVVDNLSDQFYEYSILKADGAPYPAKQFTIARQDGLFEIDTINTTEGIFFARFSTVQLEHVLIFNNISIFNDIIYDIQSGYRQRRINVSGFRTSNWNGDFFSPGFLWDDGVVQDWQPYTDYQGGATVRYGRYYFYATFSIPGSENFNPQYWSQLVRQPTAQLIPNIEYKISQFEDFYSLDIDNFDAGVQALAQHLTGYSRRPYLDNIFSDQIAQYKFYQGFIKEKGTKNSISRLAKASLHSLKGQVDYFETWAVRAGYYGGFRTLREIEISLADSKFLENPQIIEFVDQLPTTSDLIYRKLTSDILVKPDDYTTSTTFVTSTGTLSFSSITMPTAGYVAYDDVKATAYNKNSLLDIANNKQLSEGDRIWLGFREDNNWDVLRYTKMRAKVIDAAITDPNNHILTFYTDKNHNLKAGDLVSVTRFNPALDKIYIVITVPYDNEFTVATSVATIPTNTETPVGLMFNFVSARLSHFDDIASYPALNYAKTDDLVWVDSDRVSGDGKWAVFKKTDNYTGSIYADGITDGAQNFGATLAMSTNSLIAVVGAPTYFNPRTTNDPDPDIGRVFVLNRAGANSSEISAVTSYGLNDTSTYYVSATVANFGASVLYESYDNLIYASAPNASNLKISTFNGVSTLGPGNAPDTTINGGAVKITSIDTTNYLAITKRVLASPNPTNYGEFGTSMAVQRKTGTKILAVGAPGDGTGGAVYLFNVAAGAVITPYAPQPTLTHSYPQGSLFGTSLDASDDFSTIVVGVPQFNGSVGQVSVYNLNTTTGHYNSYTISATTINQRLGFYDSVHNVYTSDYYKTNAQIGKKIKVSADGNYLFISAPGAQNGIYTGAVIVCQKQNGQFVPVQDIRSPSISTDLEFGVSIDVDATATTLVISALGDNFAENITFDTYRERLVGGQRYQTDPDGIKNSKATTFDSGSTKFFNNVVNAGAVHIYNRYNNLFIYSQELSSYVIPSNSGFGTSVALNYNSVLVGAPLTLDANNLHSGALLTFTQVDPTVKSWQLYRSESDLVDLDNINKVYTLNDFTQEIVDYIEIIDPIKGKIAGIADQELSYKTPFDPAVYSLGVSGVVVDSNTNWIDEHVGQLWWDLSTVKYVWYEQGSPEYRKNNWNGVFPGSTIDVYEWIGTSYLPSQWSALADTTDGLALGISGQPKFPDNSVMSVKQVYNSITNAFTNVYYYWVKNKTVLPNVPTRRISSYETAQYIANPTAQGLKYAMFLSNNSLALVNVKSTLQAENVHLCIQMDSIANTVQRHVEWLLIEDGNAESLPTVLLEQKLFDSIIGIDSLGSAVPDLSLPSRIRYGIEFRPKQSMFVNKFEARRDLFEYVNNIISNYQLLGNINMANLDAKDPVPPATSGLYDQVVEDQYTLALIVTKFFEQATVEVKPNIYGFIDTIKIINPGVGYNTENPPFLTITGDGSGAVIQTQVNEQGQVIGFKVISGGSGYSQAVATIRPYTVIILSDSESLNQWAKYEWRKDLQAWNKVQTQSYDTTQYWTAVDYVDASYNQNQPVVASVDSVYELAIVNNVASGNYVKVKDSGDGKYSILRRTVTGAMGTFDADWDLVYKEKGTIQFNDSIWNVSTPYAFDELSAFDQTQFDQSAESEIRYILQALKNDIFINDLRVYWNGFFIKAIKYAMSEQKNLDWAFKTTFIGVTNHAGSLDQRPTYKLQDSSYYESYINEVKPYHSKIRNFTVNYTSTDLSSTFVGDYDLPAYWDNNQQRFRNVEFGNSNLLVEPWNSWFNNFTYSVSDIVIGDPGAGYTKPPIVQIIAAPGDLGSGATAVAYVSRGQITRIEITNSGKGYAATPTVVLNGGGGNLTTPARLYAQLGNSPVRNTTITMKFDRVGRNREVGGPTYKDQYTGNGSTYTFDLTWVPSPEKKEIELYVNGVLQLSDSYTINYTSKQFTTYVNSSYLKRFASLVLNQVPGIGVKVLITYKKDIEYYTAMDRIQDYYKPSAGMPGNTATLLMSGLEYPGVQIDTLPYSYSGGWDSLPYWSTSWDNFSANNNFATVLNPQTQTLNQLANLTSLVTAEQTNNTNLINEISYYTATLLTISPQISVATGAGVQTIPNPQYTGIVAQISSLTNQLIVSSATIATYNTDIAIVNAGETIVPIPFTVTATATINTYLNGKRIDSSSTGSVTQTITLTPGATAQVIIANSNSNWITANGVITGTNIVTFRDAQDDGTTLPTDDYTLDTILSGADYNPGITLGVQPAEIVVDGDSYISANASYAPEEMIPGQIQESFAVSVFTQLPQGSPLITNYKYQLDGQTVAFNIARPQSTNSFIVVAGNRPLHYGTDYLIDITNGNLSLTTPLSGPDWLSISTMETGGTGLVDKQVDVNANAYTVLTSAVSYNDIKDVYVSVNGLKVPPAQTATIMSITYTNPLVLNLGTVNASGLVVSTSSQLVSDGTGFVLYDTSGYLNGALFVKNIGNNQVAAYSDNGFQVPIDARQWNKTYVMNSAVIGVNGWTLHKGIDQETSADPRGYLSIAKPSISIANPAAVNYTQVWFFNQPAKAVSEVYQQVIKQAQGNLYNLEQPPGIAKPYHSQVIVEYNGVRLIPPETIYYKVQAGQFLFSIKQDIAYARGIVDEAHVEVYINGEIATPGVQYTMNQPQGLIQFPQNVLNEGDALAIVILDQYDYLIENNQIVLSSPLSVTRGPNDTLRIISFTNHDGDQIRREKFKGNKAGYYRIQRPVYNTNYIWMEYNGKSLIADLDFTVEADGVSIQVLPQYYQSPDDVVVVLSMSTSAYRGALGYKMFTDILGRTGYKRINSSASTTLAKALQQTDTFIYVEDGSVLTPPNPITNTPGVIYVAGERIEYLTQTDNLLGTIRRGTLGTGVAEDYPAGTRVIDQGRAQDLAVSESTKILRITATNTVSYTLTNITLSPFASAEDQVEVFYAGQKLLKPGLVTTQHDGSVAYDSSQTNSFSTSSDITVQPSFTISTASIYPVLTLNIANGVQPGLGITVFQRTGHIMYQPSSTVSMQEISNPIVNFLKQGTASLPDDAYYGGDVVLTFETNQLIQTEDGKPIEGA